MMSAPARAAANRSRLALPFAVGLVASGIIARAARQAHALSRGGALAALPVGSIVFAGAGLRGSVALMAYFGSSSLLGRLPGGAALSQRRGNERDAVQVLANGAVPAILALLARSAKPWLRPLLLTGFGGAVAAATADTWATEVGSRLGRSPRSIIGLRRVSAGTSGGVTIAGLGAAAAGSGMIAALCTVGQYAVPCSQPVTNVPVALGGIVGALVDSLLGATLQEVRVCPACRQESELLIHGCGRPTMHARGLAWCTNDTVNTLAILAGAAAATGAAVTSTTCPPAPTIRKALGSAAALFRFGGHV